MSSILFSFHNRRGHIREGLLIGALTGVHALVGEIGRGIIYDLAVLDRL